jgi:hypothetical protein
MVLSALQVLHRIQSAIAADNEQGAHWLNEAQSAEWAKHNQFLIKELKKLSEELADTPDVTLELLRSLAIDIDAMRDTKEGEHWFGGFETNKIDFSDNSVSIEWPNLSLMAAKVEEHLTKLDQEGLMP